MDLFLDCGAFSAWKQKQVIDIQEYIDFVQAQKHKLHVYAALDDIEDPKRSLLNYQEMVEQGLDPIPCFHYGEDFSYLKKYLEDNSYIALGGMVGISTNLQYMWLKSVFNLIPDDVKIHGFGMTTIDLLHRFPWYSVDSTSAVRAGGFGGVYIPIVRKEEWNFEQPWVVCMTEESANRRKFNTHYHTLTPINRRICDKWLNESPFTYKELNEEYLKRWAANFYYFQNMSKAIGIRIYMAGSEGKEGYSWLNDYVDYRLISYWYVKTDPEKRVGGY